MAFEFTSDELAALGRLALYNGGATPPNNFGNGGHRTYFVPALQDVGIITNALKRLAEDTEALRDDVADQVALALEYAGRMSATSTSSNALTTGAKSFTTQEDKFFEVGRTVRVVSNANPTTHWMDILITSYSSTLLQGDVVDFRGSGSRSDWTIRVTGAPGRHAGIPLIWSTNTAASDPGTGKVKINNGTVGSATALYISETDFAGNALGPLLATWDDSTSVIKGRLFLSQASAGTFLALDITSTLTDNGTWDTFTVAYAGGASFADGALVQAQFFAKGDKGDIGATGASYAATSTTSLLIETPATKVFTTQSGLAYVFGQRVRATDASNAANWMEGQVTYSGTTLTMTVDLIGGSGTIANWTIGVAGQRGATGAAATITAGTTTTLSPGAPATVTPVGTSGAQIFDFAIPAGAGGLTGPAGPTTAPTWLFNSSTTDADPGSNTFRLNNATVASVTKVFLDNLGPGAVDISAFIDTWDDVTNAVGKGSLFVTQSNDSSKWLKLLVGTVTNDTGYRDVTVTYIAGPGGFTSGQACAFAFTAFGNDGAGSGSVNSSGTVANNHLAGYGDGTGNAIKSLGLKGALANKDSVATGDIDASAVTDAKLADMAQGTVKGRAAGAGTGAPTDRTDAQLKTDMAFTKADVGLGSVDNTSDSGKPISTLAQAAIDALRARPTVRAATTANITISTALNSGDALDGVTLADGDLILVKDQTSTAQNGVYVVGAVPARSGEFASFNAHPGAVITVQEGTVNADTAWNCTSNRGGTLDTNALVFAKWDIGSYAGSSSITLASGSFSLNLSNANTWAATQTFLNAGIKIQDTDASHALTIVAGSNLSANRSLTWATGDADRTVTLGGNFSIGGTVSIANAFSTVGAYSIALTATGNTALTLPTSGTLATTDASSLTSGTLADARLSAAATAYGKQGVPLPAGAFVTRTTNGAAAGTVEMTTNKNMLKTWDFDTGTVEYIQTCFPVPKSLDESATVSFRIRWTAASGSGGVAFSMAIRATTDDDAIDGAYGTAVTVTDTFITANDDHRTAESGAITIGNSFAEGDMLWIQVAREVANGSDTLAVDAKLIGVELFLTTNSGNDA